MHYKEIVDAHRRYSALCESAPFLLAALKDAQSVLESYWQGDTEGRPLAERINQAIALAEGRGIPTHINPYVISDIEQKIEHNDAYADGYAQAVKDHM